MTDPERLHIKRERDRHDTARKPERPSRIRTPALDTWRRELATGQRTRTTFDALWRAACAEMAALEAPVPEIRDSCLAEARRIIESARKGGAA
jgi:hypothetical protein